MIITIFENHRRFTNAFPAFQIKHDMTYNKFHCRKCNFTAATDEELSRHKQKHRTCPYCRVIMESGTGLAKHMQNCRFLLAVQSRGWYILIFLIHFMRIMNSLWFVEKLTFLLIQSVVVTFYLLHSDLLNSLCRLLFIFKFCLSRASRSHNKVNQLFFLIFWHKSTWASLTRVGQDALSDAAGSFFRVYRWEP